MSYSIHYAPARPDKYIATHSRHWFLTVFAVMIVIIALGIHIFFPEEGKMISVALFPWMQEEAVQVLNGFAEDIADGMPLYEALTAFCSEILNEAPAAR